MTEIVLSDIGSLIYVVRGKKVMIDSDLAELYGMETKVFNQQVKRNLKRFPEDFMMELTNQEFANLKENPEFASKHGRRKYNPRVFTELGVSMLSSVLNSDKAIEVNISLMRAFVQMRHILAGNQALSQRLDNLEGNLGTIFKDVLQRLDNLEGGLPAQHPNRKRIGLNGD